MTADEVERVLVTLTGRWPSPALSLPEQIEWAECLVELKRLDLAVAVLRGLSDTGVHFRPVIGEFKLAYNQALARKRMNKAPPELAEPLASEETRTAFLAQARAALR